MRFRIFMLLFPGLTSLGFLFSPEPPPDGERLARVFCASCHLFPEPAQLPRSLWESVILPQMGYQLGFYPSDSMRMTLFEKGPGGRLVHDAGIFPAQPAISAEHWRLIREYYLKNAPDALTLPLYPEIADSLPLFRPRVPEWRLSPPSATLVQFRQGGGLFLGDANAKRLYWLDDSLRVEKAANLAEGVVSMQKDQRGHFVTIMGSFSPTDAPSGAVIYLPEGSPRAQLLLEGLQRPVHSVWDDVNGDGLRDGVVCEFAKLTGGLNVYFQEKGGSFRKHTLRNKPGATRAYLRDLNGDGAPDIVALFAQGDEGIWRYMNDGKGNFTEEPVLRFPPTYGSSAFRLQDIDGDGLEDIVYTCGDNADYSPVPKPYHGIRVFGNRGDGRYEETFFYPLNGAYDAVFADFDADGDLDIAAVSFFPDFTRRPNEGFLYLENRGGEYHAATFPEVTLGRWMVMDVGDLEGDGDLDIVLGPLTLEVVPDRGEVARWVQAGLPFLVLENRGK